MEPRTEAGRALADTEWGSERIEIPVERIVAIEIEALDVKRLKEAASNLHWTAYSYFNSTDDLIDEILAEYDRLSRV